MHRNWLGALAALLLLLFLTACGYVTDTESLLAPPMLSARQSEVYAALEEMMNLEDISYRYIQRGDFRSPFVFYDMDGDGEDEAVVFYYYQTDPANTWTKTLRKNAAGQWKPHNDFSTSCDQIDFVQFANLLDRESACMIVGWQNTTTQAGRVPGKFLGIYSLRGDSFHPEISRQDYLELFVEDFDRDGLAEIIIVERIPETQRLEAALFRSTGQHIVKTDSLPLYEEVEDLLGVTVGRRWDGGTAVYIDEVLMGGVAGTEVLRAGEDGLTLLVGGAIPSTAEEENLAWEDFTSTFRSNSLISRDYNGDNAVEIPGTSESLPGNLFEGDEFPLWLTPMLQLTAEGLQVMYSAVINESQGYVFFMPDKWLEWPVSIVRDSEDLEWKFYLLDVDSLDPTIELLRIQSYDLATGNISEESGIIPLGSRGTRGFSGYIPLTTADAPSIEEQELLELFHLLS